MYKTGGPSVLAAASHADFSFSRYAAACILPKCLKLVYLMHTLLRLGDQLDVKYSRPSVSSGHVMWVVQSIVALPYKRVTHTSAKAHQPKCGHGSRTVARVHMHLHIRYWYISKCSVILGSVSADTSNFVYIAW